MNGDSEFLLVYGSLLRSLKHPYSHLLSIHGEILGIGKFPGRLFDLGHYPGATYEPESSNWVFGELNRLDSHQKVIPLLDKYEGIGIRFKRPYEFIRVKVPVTTDFGPLQAWIYQYNLNTSGKTIIESGDYVQFRTGKGLAIGGRQD